MSDSDFITSLSNFEEFLKYPIIEDKNAEEPYPVGLSIQGIRIHFKHYGSINMAIEKWNERLKRVNLNNIGVMLTFLDGDETI